MNLRRRLLVPAKDELHDANSCLAKAGGFDSLPELVKNLGLQWPTFIESREPGGDQKLPRAQSQRVP